MECFKVEFLVLLRRSFLGSVSEVWLVLHGFPWHYLSVCWLRWSGAPAGDAMPELVGVDWAN